MPRGVTKDGKPRAKSETRGKAKYDKRKNNGESLKRAAQVKRIPRRTNRMGLPVSDKAISRAIKNPDNSLVYKKLLTNLPLITYERVEKATSWMKIAAMLEVSVVSLMRCIDTGDLAVAMNQISLLREERVEEVARRAAESGADMPTTRWWLERQDKLRQRREVPAKESAKEALATLATALMGNTPDE